MMDLGSASDENVFIFRERNKKPNLETPWNWKQSVGN